MLFQYSLNPLYDNIIFPWDPEHTFLKSPSVLKFLNDDT